MSNPVLVVMTPVRNEAWVLRAFLEATSLWADYIIIADQMSTDESRAIVKEYPKCILIDNDRKEMHMAATRRLLFNVARKIEGDKILFALDADEFLSGDFVNTEDWHKILNSKPNDVFRWRWMNLKRGDTSKYSTYCHYYWAVHDSEDVWNGEFPDHFIHEWRLPWPPKIDKSNVFMLDDFCSIHLARVNELRQRNKERFYQVSTVSHNSKSAIAIFRHYHSVEKLDYYDVPDDSYKFYKDRGLDIWKYINLQDEGLYYTEEIIKYFRRDGLKKYAMLDIWDKDWMKRYDIKDPRTWINRVIQYYLRKTNSYRNSYIIKVIDKVLKQFV